MPGSPWSYVNSLSLGSLGDSLIGRGETRPFVAVSPVAGPSGHYDGEWAGPWEAYLVRRVVPWTDAHLPTIADASGRTLAGLSAGGYGAVDVGLRHPLLFGRLESWGGYFAPFRDGPLARATRGALAAHDPTLLARREAALLRRRAVRFFLSTGPSHGAVERGDTIRFARELRQLRLPYRLELVRRGRGVWQRQLAAGLRWALRRTARGRAVDLSFASRALGGRLALVAHLPPGYGSSCARYSVVYFLHGLPASPVAYRNVGALARSLDSLRRKAILVAPQGARDGDSDPEYLDWGPGRSWETAIAEEVPRYVDGHFRTIPGRRGRALVGLSAGGYGAVLLALHHLRDFSVVESWSGYQHPTNPAGTQALDLGTDAANRRASAHAFVPTLRRAFRRTPTFFAFYVGNRDARFRAENERLDDELTQARVPHVFRLYAGTHEQALWTAHARAWLGLAVAHLAPARCA